MAAQIKILSRLELCNLFGWNVIRHSKDPKVKRRALGMAAAWGLVIAVMAVYMGGLSYGLIFLGLAELVPAYLMCIASIMIFCFGVFKSGSFLFQKNSYDMLCSLPLSSWAIVLSRFVRLYAEDLAVTLVVLLPGGAVYGWMVRPGLAFYLLGILSIGVLPLVPMAAAALVGTAVTAVSSRMKHKSLAEAVISVLLVLAVLLGSFRMSEMGEGITVEMLRELSGTVLSVLRKVYPPAVWLGNALVRGDFRSALMCVAGFLAVFAAVAAGISVRFHAISRRLNTVSAKHDYRMGQMKESSVRNALYLREVKRYFSSSIYVTNTIIGPILGTVLSGAVWIAGLDTIGAVLPASLDLTSLIPFVISMVFCLMTTTAVSVSMEGKNWWIVKSLPLKTKSVLDAKILLNLSLMAPCYVLSEIFLMLALKPRGLEAVWILLIPMVIILFSCVFGITANLRFPVMDWENDVTVVKQSTPALIGGMGGPFLALLCGVAVMLVPPAFVDLAKTAVCVLLAVLTAWLYRKNNAVDLKRI